MRCQRVAVRPISNLLAVPAAITAPQLNQRLERLPRGIPFTVRRYLNGSAAAAPGWGAGTKILQTVDCHAEGEPARVVRSQTTPPVQRSHAMDIVSSLYCTHAPHCPRSLEACLLFRVKPCTRNVRTSWIIWTVRVHQITNALKCSFLKCLLTPHCHLTGMRKLLLTEPRGYPCQNADVIVEPTLSDACVLLSVTNMLRRACLLLNCQECTAPS
eukprot:SAG11_NODE_1708_length_4407_cov_6.993036_3_plen_214_part_00